MRVDSPIWKSNAQPLGMQKSLYVRPGANYLTLISNRGPNGFKARVSEKMYDALYERNLQV